MTKPKSLLSRVLNAVLAGALILLGPVMMMVGTQLVDADEELARTGVRVSGTIVYFSDARKASNRDITVEYVAADGLSRHANAPVDHDQHPSVSEKVTVAYSEQNPDEAVVIGYESDGEFLRGVGVILTAIFTSLGLILIVSGLRKSRKEKRPAPRPSSFGGKGRAAVLPAGSANLSSTHSRVPDFSVGETMTNDPNVPPYPHYPEQTQQPHPQQGPAGYQPYTPPQYQHPPFPQQGFGAPPPPPQQRGPQTVTVAGAAALILGGVAAGVDGWAAG
jgi:hypothetical protein